MRRSIWLLLFSAAVTCAMATLVLAAVLASPGRASAQGSTERITGYDAQVTVRHDGSILVDEQITYDFGADQRHGIFRVIPVRFRYNGGYDRIYPVDVRSVWSDNPAGQYSVDSTGSSVSIRIGNPDRTVTGAHRYMITYVVRGSLNAFADHDELYWNVVGNQWQVPIDRATVRVSAPAAVTRVACFAGPAGSTGACQHAAIADGVASFGQSGLGPGEGLTVVAALPKGVVASPGPILQERWSLQRAFALTPLSAGASGGLLAIVLVLGAVVLARGRDHRYATASAGARAGRPVRAGDGVPPSGRGRSQPPVESAPPEDVRPGQAGTLLDGVANPRDVTGTIVDLAVRGYLRIEAAGKRDWRLVRLEKTGGLLDYEQILLDGLFTEAGTGHPVPSTRLSKLGPAFTGSLKRAQDALYTDVARRGWFTARPDRVRRRWRITGAVLFVAGTAAIIAAAASSHFGLVPVPVALAGLVLIGCARWMPVRTAKGTDLATKLLGFRTYLTTSTAGQAHPPGQDVLDTYLPYAIVMECTQHWAEMTAAVADTDREPSWCRGGELSSQSRSAYYFSAMHHFATNTSNSITSSATGGGSSGSGFSGGFSGGGGGGGGGGSW
jgi:uncharacterized membrane protein YgcG